MPSNQFFATSFAVVLAAGTGVIHTLAIGLRQGRRAAFMATTFGIFTLYGTFTARAARLAQERV
jgi:threonine/homoserine/homoserine lactone efflux protein